MQTREFATSDQATLADPYPDRVTRFAGDVKGLPDVVYSTPPGYRPLIVDLYLPPGPHTPRPLILYIHGGGWISGHTRHAGAISDFPHLLASLAGEGFVVASLEYRLANEAPFPAQLQDARAAVRFLRANATA
jgi:acetyl esterase/lipase